MTDTETHWRKVHRRLNEHLLFAEDLEGRTSIDVEIVDSGVTSVADSDSKNDMPWIAFRGAKKKLALNATNCKTLQTLCGTGVIEKWRGPITLIVVKTTFKDRKTKAITETDAIRIAPKRPSPKSQPRRDTNTTGSGATQDEPASEIEQPTEPPPPAPAPTPGEEFSFDPDADIGGDRG